MGKQVFNPVKEDETGKMAKRMIWSSESIGLALKGLEQGRRLVANPFYEGNTQLLKGDLVFERTPEEIEEFKKCMDDIVYFANTYGKLMTPEGVQHITLRDYQEAYLRQVESNQFNIMLSARQAGKCVLFTTEIECIIDFDKIKIAKKLHRYIDSNYYNIEKKCYIIPLFEIYNFFDKTIKWKIEYLLYKLIWKILKRREVKRKKDIETTIPDVKIIKFILYIISLIDETRNNTHKLVNTHVVDGILVRTDKGYSPASHIHLTQHYSIYKISLSNGYGLTCADNHIVFNEKLQETYVKSLSPGDQIYTDEGLFKVINIEHFPIRVSMCDLTINDINHRYYTNGILSHNTVTSALFMLHYICFNSDKSALILGNKRGTAVDILNKLKSIYYEIPYFLKPGILKWNDSECVFDNGCRIKAEATTINSGIGMTIHCCLMDEFAHVPPNILDKFYNNLLPVVTATKGKVLITSTQNGYNLFYIIWMSAKSGDSSYTPFEVTWDMIPEWNPDTRQWEKRDEKWHRMQVANYGGEEAFNKQFGTSFDISSNTLISQKILAGKRTSAEIYPATELPGVGLADYYHWKPGYEPLSDLKNDFLVVTCDIAEGIGQDATVYIFNRVSKEGLECIGYFRCNDQRRELCADSLVDIITRYCNIERILVSHEKNTYGDLFLRELKDYKEGALPVDILVRYNHNKKSRRKFDHGIKITAGNKTPTCKIFKEQYELGKLVNNSSAFIDELVNFVNDGSDHFAASFGHDDMVMAEIQVVFVMGTLQYKYMREEYEALQTTGQTPTSQGNSFIDPNQTSGPNIYNF